MNQLKVGVLQKALGASHQWTLHREPEDTVLFLKLDEIGQSILGGLDKLLARFTQSVTDKIQSLAHGFGARAASKQDVHRFTCGIREVHKLVSAR